MHPNVLFAVGSPKTIIFTRILLSLRLEYFKEIRAKNAAYAANDLGFSLPCVLLCQIVNQDRRQKLDDGAICFYSFRLLSINGSYTCLTLEQ